MHHASGILAKLAPSLGGGNCRLVSQFTMWTRVVFLLNFTIFVLGFTPRRLPHKMSYSVEEIGGPFVLGEGPHWEPERQALYFVDALASTINRYLPDEDRITTCKIDESAIVSIVIPVKGKTNKFLVTVNANLTEVTWDGETAVPEDIRFLGAVDREPGLETNRFNDGKVDPLGRLWIGTVGGMNADKTWKLGKGFIYSFDSKLHPRKHESNITIANGLAWSADLKSMYYIDTWTKRVDVFDYDSETGDVANRRPLFDFVSQCKLSDGAGPDGMTIDSDGNLWVAVWGCGGVYNIDPRTGQLLRKIDIPSPLTTSVAFGGPNLEDLYVTSARTDLPEEEMAKIPGMGKTFRVTGLGVRGLPMLPVELTI